MASRFQYSSAEAHGYLPVDPRVVIGYKSELFLWGIDAQRNDHPFEINRVVVDAAHRNAFLPQRGQVVRYVPPGGPCPNGALCYVNTAVTHALGPDDDNRRSCTVLQFGPGDPRGRPVCCLLPLPPQVIRNVLDLQDKISHLNGLTELPKDKLPTATDIAGKLAVVNELLIHCDHMLAQTTAPDPAHRQMYATKPMLFSLCGLRQDLPYLVIPVFRLLGKYDEGSREQSAVRFALQQIIFGEPMLPISRLHATIGGNVAEPPQKAEKWM
eukprot:TRINITY_DN10386_c0_g1_i2.p1 TRINITY_DN10386_c0_g1~~TRINITY_DN10386_c0_g1_i2.p1  ORF type:complete len:299 (+),score=58.89 TRINITY_DN10386_c0_g1_i2:93-899(+)